MASRRKLQTTASVGGHPANVNPAPTYAEEFVSAEIEELDDSAIAALTSFFKTLDQWDWEAKQNGQIM